jgi:hypothetical protein
MKLRLGFVSNSSSSSFILKLDTNADKKKVEKAIAVQIGEVVKAVAEHELDWGETPAEGKKQCNKVKNAFLRLKKTKLWPAILKGELGVQFPSVNYHTYILRCDDRVLCDTSWHLRCFDFPWTYVSEMLIKDDGDKISEAKYVSFNHDLKVMTYKDIEDDWN